ncbi:MAG: hypothetical protein IJ647_06385 [Prevotella sp.]|nr:hypothetical protein [Prevotella sp.]
MEEKRYPTEHSVDACSEPVAEPMPDYETLTTRRSDGATEVHDWIDNLDWDRFPSQGPFSAEEALARIDRFEERMAKGEVRWISSEDAWAQLYERHPWLR